jgi:hypothetical protein
MTIEKTNLHDVERRSIRRSREGDIQSLRDVTSDLPRPMDALVADRALLDPAEEHVVGLTDDLDLAADAAMKIYQRVFE